MAYLERRNLINYLLVHSALTLVPDKQETHICDHNHIHIANHTMFNLVSHFDLADNMYPAVNEF